MEQIKATALTGKYGIVVFGNMGSGKSTFCRNIKKLLPTYQYILIDTIRKNFANKYINVDEFKMETLCMEELKRQIFSATNLIYETTAATKLFESIKPRLRGYFKTFYIYIKCPVHECQNRCDIRKQKGHKIAMPPIFKNRTELQVLHHFENKHYNVGFDLELNSAILSEEEMITKFIDFFNSKI